MLLAVQYFCCNGIGNMRSLVISQDEGNCLARHDFDLRDKSFAKHTVVALLGESNGRLGTPIEAIYNHVELQLDVFAMERRDFAFKGTGTLGFIVDSSDVKLLAISKRRKDFNV